MTSTRDRDPVGQPAWWRRHFFIQRAKPFPWWWIGAPLAAVLLAFATFVGIPDIEDDLTDKVSRELANGAGIDVGRDVEVSFDGRSGTIRGELPRGLTIAEVRRRLEAIEGVRDIDVSQLVEQGPEPEPEPAVDEEPEPEAAEPEPTGFGLDATASFDGERIVLSGTVLSDAEAATLTDAAEALVGAEHVVDDLQRAAPPQSTDASMAKVIALADSMTAFGGDVDTASLGLTDTDLDYLATAASPEAAQAFELAVGVGSSGLLASGEVELTEPEEVPTEVQIDQLQSELDDLAGEIRETVVFETGGAALSAEAMATLDKAVALINRYESPVVEVGGHTDDQGDDAANLSLSAARAQSVALYLAQAGVDPGRVSAVGYGETEPIADNSTADGRLQNRRVELVAMASAG